jgi:hypothetical protein
MINQLPDPNSALPTLGGIFFILSLFRGERHAFK